jgi:hypothetical protein
MAPSLGSTFFNSVTVFNNTFIHLPPYTPAELNNVGQFYDPNIRLVTPTLKVLHPRDAVLDDFAQSSPLIFGPNLSNLDINEYSGIVRGDGPYHDTDHGVPTVARIHFEFRYVLTPGGWLIKQAHARTI